MRDHTVSIPFLPRTSRKSCPMGRANVVPRRSGTEAVAKDAAIRSNQPNDAVAPTPTKIAKGAARAAFVVSSLMCAAESSELYLVQKEALTSLGSSDVHPVSVHIGAVNARQNAQPSTRNIEVFSERKTEDVPHC